MTKQKQELARAISGAFVALADGSARNDEQMQTRIKRARAAVQMAAESLSKGDGRRALSYMTSADKELQGVSHQLENNLKDTLDAITTFSKNVRA